MYCTSITSLFRLKLWIHCLAVILLTVSLVTANCIWYDECGNSKNCLYRGEPKPLKDKQAIKTLKELCPQLVPKSAEYPLTCCSPKQIVTLDKNMSVPRQILARCPACLNNFISLFCHSTCHPNQSEFMAVDDKDVDNQTDRINVVDYAVSIPFAYGLFNSCRDVQNPSSGQKALDMLCGRSASDCTPETWMKFLGDKKQNPLVPFTIHINVTDKNYTYGGYSVSPMDDDISPCNTSCSCQDCSAQCKPIPPITPPNTWNILGYDAMWLICAAIFAVFLLLFVTIEFWKHLYCASEDEDILFDDTNELLVNGDDLEEDLLFPSSETVAEENKEDYLTNCCSRLALNISNVFVKSFAAWGQLCAYRPWTVICCALVICLAMSLGIIWFKVTTDPVELWSSPDSRARTEKDYFDDNFTPFYRTEMLIVKAKNNSKWLREDLSTPTQRLYGPVLRKEILHEVLDLQMSLRYLTVYDSELGMNVSLDDICFSPLSPDNPNCTIMTALNYFQNDHSVIDRERYDEYGVMVEADYITHFTICTGDPLTVNDLSLKGTNASCLSDFGAPVMPWVALGGYEESQYGNSSALVITFTVNNFKNDTFQKMALAWEKGFLNLMKNFTGINITVDYSAERSIQDELNRESQSDVFTILVSYLIMFGYVSLSLGEYQSVTRLFYDSKIILGLCGVLIVLISVISSIGFFSYIGIPATLIIIEVVPFLVLAVGVDNIFILVQTYQV